MTPRAAPLAPEDRRTAILAALIPLLVEKGGEVTTKELLLDASVKQPSQASVQAKSLDTHVPEHGHGPIAVIAIARESVTIEITGKRFCNAI